MHGVDSNTHFRNVEGFGNNSISHQGDTVHVNNAKVDYLYWLAYDESRMPPDLVAMDFNDRINGMHVKRKVYKD